MKKNEFFKKDKIKYFKEKIFDRLVIDVIIRL